MPGMAATVSWNYSRKSDKNLASDSSVCTMRISPQPPPARYSCCTVKRYKRNHQSTQFSNPSPFHSFQQRSAPSQRLHERFDDSATVHKSCEVFWAHLMKMVGCFRGQQVSTCTCVCVCKLPSGAPFSGDAMVDYALQDADEPEVQRLRAALRAKEHCIDRQEEELRTCRQRINNLEVSWGPAAK